MAIDVSEAEFQSKVIEGSKNTPVLVDFWAEWCGPCRMLGPVLEKIEKDLGTFILVKVNTDQNPGVSSQYKISGIPAVKLFVGGEVAAEFTGALSEPMVLRFLEEHLPDESLNALLELAKKDPLRAAKEALLQNKTGSQATSIYWKACLSLLSQGKTEGELQDFLNKIPTTASPSSEAANALRQFLSTKEKPSEPFLDLLNSFPENGNEVSEKLKSVLDRLLENVEKAPSSQKEAPKLEMLFAFQVLGRNTSLVNEYRKKLSRVLF